MRSCCLVVRALLATFLVGGWALGAGAQGPLRTLAGPSGGMILYGRVDRAETPAAAMGVILRNLHQQYGDRPQVGRVFKVRGTDSTAVFFTLQRQKPAPMTVAGMLLVATVPGHVEAAVLSDEAGRFGTSINPMLQRLFENWTPGGRSLAGPGGASGGGTAGAGVSAAVAPLRTFRLQDGSASVALAEGWRVLGQSGGGTILAQGPRGEMLALGFPYAAHNSNDPRAQQMRQFAMSAAGRNTSYGKVMYAPYGMDLGETFADLNAQASRLGNPAVGAVSVAHTQALRPNGGARCAIVAGNKPAASGMQALQFEGTFCQAQMDGSGGFMNLATLAFAPPEAMAREQATLRAMLGSFQVNDAIVSAQAAALAGPTIAAIHEIGRQVTQRIRESDRQGDERRAAFDRHNDAMDRSSQGFSNYMLDKSVIRDNQYDAHGTMWNSTAEALVNSDPKRFEYVATPSYWKGIDY